MDKLYTDVSYKISRLVTREYSTSFSRAVSLLGKEERRAIYSIYGFVRYADEIVDTFHSVDRKAILESYRNEYNKALLSGVSTNPILHSFQLTVRKYDIDGKLVEAFLKSMYDDLFISNYSGKEEIKQYIHGSAEVVGLMCLKVFVNGNSGLYEELKQPATRLGSAFQKVNFLRDLKTDTEILNRQYFPELAGKRFTDEIRGEIIEDICADFSMSYPGIKSLPGRSRLAVAIAFFFYKRLLDKIRGTPADIIISSRVRLSRIRKFLLIVRAFVAYIFRLI